MPREVRKSDQYVRVFNKDAMLIDGGLWVFWDREGPGHPATHVGAQLIEDFDGEADETRWVEADLAEDETVVLTLTQGEGNEQVAFDLHVTRGDDGINIDAKPREGVEGDGVSFAPLPALLNLA